jgi:ligand-binding sensor domain-containing protein
MTRFTFISLLFLTKVVFAQQPTFSFINFDAKEGLGEKFIYSMTQDDFGSIWLGTGSGLYRFNGKYFDKINSTEDRPGRQINNILQTVYKDTNGKLWLSSINTIQIYDIPNHAFTSFNDQNPINTQVIDAFVNAFYRDTKGNFWIGTREGYWFRYDESKQTCVPFIPKDPKLNQNSKFVAKLIETENGNMWALTFNGLFEFDASGKISAHFGSNSNNEFSDGYYDPINQCIWLAAGFEGIAKFDLQQKKFSFHPLIEKNSKNQNPANYVTTIIPKNETEIWFGASNLGVYNKVTHSFYTIPQSYQDEFSFKTAPIARLYKDTEQNLWIPSFKGLSMLPWQNQQIKTINLFNQLGNYTVEPYGVIAYKDNDYLIANNTSNGLLWWQAHTQKLSVIENPFHLGKYKDLKGIVAVVKNSKNEIYGVSDDHLFILNQIKNQLIPINLSMENGTKLQNITRMVVDEQDNLYLYAPNNGFYFVDISSKKVKHFNLTDVDPNNKDNASNLIAPRLKDSQNRMWFTMTQGVYVYDKNQKYTHHATQKAINTGASIVQSIDILEYDKNNYWITTIDNGVFNLILNDKESKLYNYTSKNSGLPSDYCNRIIKDEKGYLWIGTLNGLARFNPKTQKVETVLNKQNGLYDHSAAQIMNLLPNGDLVINYFGALSVLNVKNYQFNLQKPKVHLIAITALDKPLSFFNQKSLTLKYFQNFISINWNTDVYNNFNQSKSAYRLIPYQEEWIETYENSVSLANLKNGAYTFQVKACNNDGIWGDPIAYSLIIRPPFWKTWWFFTWLAIIVGGVLYAFYYYKLQKIKSEAKLKARFTQDLAQIEMKALRAQMNPHFIFNSLNSIQKFILKNDTFAASQYLTKFSKLIRLILDHSNQHYIQLSQEIEQLKLYTEIEALRFDQQFDYTFEIDPNLKSELLYIPSMIIQPYIENAIWHGLLHKEDRGALKITFENCLENCIRVSIEDNGIGREKAQQLKSKQVLKKKSYGMEITHNRIEILNKIENENTICQVLDLKDVNGNPLGTRVELTIPLKKQTNLNV